MIVSSVKSSPSTETLNRTELQLSGVWRVVVLNDPVNLMSYVMMVFKKIFGFSETTARRHMLEVHEQVARWFGAGSAKKQKRMCSPCSNGI